MNFLKKLFKCKRNAPCFALVVTSNEEVLVSKVANYIRQGYEPCSSIIVTPIVSYTIKTKNYDETTIKTEICKVKYTQTLIRK